MKTGKKQPEEFCACRFVPYRAPRLTLLLEEKLMIGTVGLDVLCKGDGQGGEELEMPAGSGGLPRLPREMQPITEQRRVSTGSGGTTNLVLTQ